MDVMVENKGYTLAVLNRKTTRSAQKVYMKPMALYVPSVAAAAVSALIENLGASEGSDERCALTVTNNNNGVSVDKDFASFADLTDETTAADAVKELINIVRGYDDDGEHNVCGW